MPPDHRARVAAAREPRPLVGRDDELARLGRALAAASAGEATVLLVTGEPGIGKSSLVRAAFAAGDPGLVLAEAGCDEAERELEYGVVHQLVATAPVAAAPPRPGASSEPFQVGAGLLELIGRAQEGGAPVVVVVDDVQWADDRSLQALAFAARRLRADRVLLCLLSRPDGVERLPDGLLRRIEQSGDTITLAGLGRDDILALATREYGVALRPLVAERLRAHTGGNPLHLRTLLDTLPASALDHRGPLPVPSSYSSLVAAQVDSCSTSARQVLAALAVLGPDATVHESAAVADVAGGLEAAEELGTLGLVDLTVGETETRLAFRHTLVRDSVLEGLRPSHRLRLHAAAARVLGGHDALRHRLAATTVPDPGLVDSAREQADALAASGALTPAARLLTAAARQLGAGRQREELVLAAAMLLLDAGAPVDSLAPEIARYRAGPARDFVLGRLAFNRGDHTAAVHLLTQAWAATPADSSMTAPVADMLAIVSTALGRFDELAMWSRRAVAAESVSLNSPVMLFYGVALTSSLSAAEQELTGLVEGGRGEGVRLGAHLARGLCLLARNDLDRAETELSAASLAPRVQGSIQALVNARAFLAECHFRRGRWARAHDLAVSTASIADDAGASWMAPLPHSVAATVLAAQGELEAARAHAAEARSVAEELGMAQGLLWSGVASMRIAEAAHDHEQVAEFGDRLLDLGAGGLPDWVQRRRPTYAEALVALGRAEDAERQLVALEAEVSENGDRSLAAEAARVRAASLAAAGDRAGALEALDAGMALEEEPSGPFERARLELAAGALRRRAGERRAALTLLQSAAARLRTLGARPWLERCERELAACGLQPVRRSAGDAGPDLTPQERMVVHLTTAGRTNREIAAELVLSVKTVEFHLGRIYRKLGVRSRTELTARLAVDPQG